MSSSQVETTWDFSPVYSLLDALSRKENVSYDEKDLPAWRERREVGEPEATGLVSHPLKLDELETRSLQPYTGLGDFSQIWQFLGTAPELPPSSVPPKTATSPTLRQRVPGKIEYTSDGAMYAVPASVKKLQWRDEVNDGTLTDVAPTKSDEEPAVGLSKKQRKKLNRRKRLEAMEIARRAASDVDSEADIPALSQRPAVRASAHSLLSPHRKPTNHSNAASLARAAQLPTTPDKVKSRRLEELTPTIAATTSSDEAMVPAKSHHKTSDELADRLAEAGRKVLARYRSEPPDVSQAREAAHSVEKEWPISSSQSTQALSLLPASVRPKKTSNPEQTHKEVQTPTRTSTTRQIITPKIIRSGPDRHWAFLLKLIANFYEDRSSLVAPANLSNHSSDPNGIHVFVDASNIFIGFHDQLKRARGIPTTVRVPRVDMSFDALALLMERRRPVAKRVLAGSTPEVAAFDIARRIGYECSILDKVYKARELTARQRYFIGRERRGSKASKDTDHEGYSSGGGGSGESSDVPTHAPQKYVEQGVDEILHLKMLESVVDAESDVPGTMVLATGDAAQAEYSSGFMVMVERALKRGWKVELVSWSSNISSAYTRDGFRRKWGDNFKIVELDDYAEELLDM
ncbi:hypothetical protein ANO11243_045790 [Dothideomycetidae sp. 11243]|nr:hypothetical protein ANO11243_045790 [fungal sp. No.11243]